VNASPLRLSYDRIVLYGTLIALLCAIQVRFVVAQRFGDWSAFWAAGATAGTHDLLDPRRHAAWQLGHHLLTTVFPYLPGFAWLFAPAQPLSQAAGYALNFAAMLLVTICAALIAARVYRLSRGVAVALSLAWAPVVAAMATGQNAPLGLLLEIIAIAGLVADSWAACGLAVGLLLYKLSYALPLIALLAVRRNWRALAIVAGCAFLWYVASAAATAWDWQWPLHYVDALRVYAGPDAQFNADKAVSIPQLLARAGVAQGASMLAGAAMFALCLPLLRRWSAAASASFTPLLGLAFGPHTLPYDLTLALPAIFYASTRFEEPLRTRLICAIYVLAPLWLLSGILHFDVLAAICEGMLVFWLIHRPHEPAFSRHLRIAHTGNRSEA
jgi:hypothetical protein